MARIVLALMLLTPSPALAHKLNLFAQAQGGAVVGHAYFPGDVPAQHIDVIARDRSNHELARTKTDEQGNFSFPATSKTDYQITAETSDGHAASFTLSAAELPNSLPSNASDTTSEYREVIKPTVEHGAAGNGTSPSPLSDQINGLERQIQALRDQVDRSEQKLRLRDILGGVGYILGLAGIALLVKSRRTKAF
jgi:nickel transport protein